MVPAGDCFEVSDLDFAEIKQKREEVMFAESCPGSGCEAMTLQKWLVMFLLLSYLLCNAACLGRQVQRGGATPPAAIDSRNTPTQSEGDTKEYIHGWTFPDADPAGKPSVSAPSEENRERMIPDDTDSYIRAFTFPTSSEEMQKEPASASKPHPSQPLPTPADDIDDYINGWTFD